MTGDPSLVAAARFERDRRFTLAPAKLAERGADVEKVTIDCQCWTAIAEWVETGRFFSFVGGSDPDRPDAPLISWPEIEATAERALSTVSALCDRLFAAETVQDGEYEAACARRLALWEIHRAISLRRESIDWINAGFQARKREIAA